MPMINMLEEIRRLAMKRISRRRDITTKWESQFPPKIMDILEENRKGSLFCTIIKSSETLYEVIEHDQSFEVSISHRHCACNKWNVTGIPCRHAFHVLTDLNQNIANYVDKYYLTTTWQDTYKVNIRPVNGESLWKRTGKEPIEVPEKRRMPGRPKKYARIKEPHESSSNPTKVTRDGRIVTCSNCQRTGHNRLTCNRAHVAPSASQRKRGRPRKNPDDPWNVQNAPRRRRTSLSQSTPTGSATQVYPPSSSAPPATTSRGRGRGRGPRRGRGRRGQEPPIPMGYGCYISPWTGRTFDVWGTSAVDINGPPPRAPPPPNP